MPDTVKAMVLLITTFDKYAKKDGNNLTLSKAELKELLQEEFGDLKEKANDKGEVDAIFNDLDLNRDNCVDFSEFVRLVTRLTVTCHEYFCTGK